MENPQNQAIVKHYTSSNYQLLGSVVQTNDLLYYEAFSM